MNEITLLLMSCVACYATFSLATKYNWTPVRASAMVTFVVALFIYMLPNILPAYLNTHLPTITIGASFIGMVHKKYIKKTSYLLLSAVLFGFIYINTSLFFKGFGGALGTTACISLLCILSISFYKPNRKTSRGFLLLRKMLFGRNKKNGC